MGIDQIPRRRLCHLPQWPRHAPRNRLYSWYVSPSSCSSCSLLNPTPTNNQHPVTPVFWYTHPSLGGYGFSPLQISMFLGGIGISQACWLLIAFPILQRKYSTKWVIQVCLIAWPIFFAAAPLCNYFLRRGWTTAFWICAPLLQIGGSGVAMAFSESLICHFFLLVFWVGLWGKWG